MLHSSFEAFSYTRNRFLYIVYEELIEPILKLESSICFYDNPRGVVTAARFDSRCKWSHQSSTYQSLS